VTPFVSLHRSKGFGRAPAEAMSLRPVILTCYGGGADFTTQDYADVIDYTLVPVLPGASRQFWAEPDIAMAAAALRAVHERPTEARAIGARAARRVRPLCVLRPSRARRCLRRWMFDVVIDGVFVERISPWT
jgi:glycosyltransferase involved in cell wall biosynthesis